MVARSSPETPRERLGEVPVDFRLADQLSRAETPQERREIATRMQLDLIERGIGREPSTWEKIRSSGKLRTAATATLATAAGMALGSIPGAGGVALSALGWLGGNLLTPVGGIVLGGAGVAAGRIAIDHRKKTRAAYTPQEQSLVNDLEERIDRSDRRRRRSGGSA
jgi:hypothetical protein